MSNLTSFHPRERGAALVIAMTAAMVVMLSVILLLGYITNMVDQQTLLEERAQARLTETSAVEGLAWMLREGRVESYYRLPDFTVGVMTTDFEVTELQSAPPWEMRVPLDDFDDPMVLPSGAGLFIAGIRDGMLVIELYDPSTGKTVPGYPIQLAGAPGLWDAAAGVVDGRPAAFVIVHEGQGDTVYAVFDGEATSFQTDLSVCWNSTSFFSVGAAGEGPGLIVTNGWNWAQLVVPATGEVYYGSSPSGTCPVFLPDGTVFGDFSDEPLFGLPGLGILDSFEGDFNRDGTPDVAWAGPTSMAYRSGLTGELILDSVASRILVAWGSVEGRFGLGGCWLASDGSRIWRRLSYGGFLDYYTGGTLDYEWYGRLEGAGNMLGGVVGDSIGTASLGLGELDLYCSTRSGILDDVDGATREIIFADGGDLVMVMNPLDGTGTCIGTSAHTRRRGRFVTGNGWDFYVYGAGDELRVFVEGEGTADR